MKTKFKQKHLTFGKTHFCAKKILGFILIVVLFTACKKFIQVGPPTNQLTAENVYANEATATAVMTGIYTSIVDFSSFLSGTTSFGYITGLEGDELKNYSSDANTQSFYQDNLTSNNLYFWNELYSQIHVSNAVIEGVAKSNTLSNEVKKRLTGEAKFMRAFLHFYAVLNYGNVPIVNSTDYLINEKSARNPTKDVLQFIVNDLKDAQINLTDDYVDPAGNSSSLRVRPNKAVATALLARVELYTGNYNDAILQSTSLINDSRFTFEALNNVFLKTSREAIWQLQPTYPGLDTYDGYYYILSSPPGTSDQLTAMSSQLVTAFEIGDQRFVEWVGVYSDGANNYYYPFKYKDGQYLDRTIDQVNEYVTVFRLAEQYLIRAEANIQLGQYDLGIADINKVRARARMAPTSSIPNPLPDLPTGLSKDAAITALLHERQVELFTEFGHRWYDLQRLGKLNDVMNQVAPLKNANWQAYKAIMPIPQSEINSDPNLKQNPGYN